MSNSTASPPHPFAELLGFTITARSEGQCTSELVISNKHLNPNNVVHGGVIYTLADTGMGGALTSMLDDGQLCATIEIKINYFRPAISGTLRCETKVVHKGRRTAAMESEVLGDDGKLLARATGTFMIFE